MKRKTHLKNVEKRRFRAWLTKQPDTAVFRARNSKSCTIATFVDHNEVITEEYRQ